jgi:hypothetical protein
MRIPVPTRDAGEAHLKSQPADASIHGDNWREIDHSKICGAKSRLVNISGASSSRLSIPPMSLFTLYDL